ncbi:hypothetical protein VTI28DRAFT_9385 [Corynascus sepedonium]
MSYNATLTTCIDRALVGGGWAARWLSPSSLASFKYATAIFPPLPKNFSVRFTLIVYGPLTPALTVSQFSSTMEVIGAVASTAAIVELAAKIASLCLKYSTAVKNARADIERLQQCIASLKTAVEGAQKLLQSPHEAQLQTLRKLREPLNNTYLQLDDIAAKLETKSYKGRRAKLVRPLRLLRLQALKWPFESNDVDKIIVTLEREMASFSTALQIDQTAGILEIDKWIEDPKGKCIFWLCGMAGTGKSTISRTVATRFSARGILGASFLFKKGDGDHGKAARLFTTIASQLVQRLPILAPHVRDTIDSDPAIADKNMGEQFQKLLLEPLNKCNGVPDTPTIISVVIDALDECDREEDAIAIIRTLSKAKKVTSVALRFYITSRPELFIRSGFDEIHGEYQDMVLHRIPEPVIEHDISAFLQSELARIRDGYNSQALNGLQIPTDWPSKDDIRDLRWPSLYSSLPQPSAALSTIEGGRTLLYG